MDSTTEDCSGNDVEAVARQSNNKWLRTPAKCGLVAGLVLITGSFVVGTVGFVTASSNCEALATGECVNQSALELRARKFRIAFGAGFTLGTIITIASVIAFHKSFRFLYDEPEDVVVSNVTECGQVKTPTPSFLRRPIPSSVTNLVEVEIELGDFRASRASPLRGGGSHTNRENHNPETVPVSTFDGCQNLPPSYEEALEMAGLREKPAGHAPDSKPVNKTTIDASLSSK